MESEKIISLPSPEEYVENTFGEGGYLARRFQGYRPRASQIALARAVDSSLLMGDHLLAEGPTGVGKSLSYLVPATYRTSRARDEIISRRKDPDQPEENEDWSKTHIVVVTANIALQEQLVNKDLPLLREVLPWDFTFALLKGKNQYLCLDSYYETKTNGFAGQPTADELDQIDAIREWAHACINGDGHGDSSELPFEPLHRAWRYFSVSTDECKGKNCQFYSNCFSVNAHDKARQANIIVTNYHMFMAHLQVRMKTGKDLVLPPFESVILDEAHKLADTARDFFGIRITAEAIRRTAKGLRQSHIDSECIAYGELDREAVGFFSALESYRRSPAYKTRIKKPLEESFHVHGAWERLRESMLRVEGALDSQIERLKKSGDAAIVKIKLSNTYKARDRSIELRAGLGAVMRLSLSDEVVYFIDVDERQRISLVQKPIHVGGLLKKHLFDPTPSVIAVSATMCVAGSFDFIADEIGCTGSSKLVAESPFAWPDQALLVIPDDMPPPNDPDFRDAVAESVLEVIQRTRGRTLGLFTSRRNLDHVHQAVKECGYKVLKQGDAPRTKLIEAFRDDISSVLLGTESFWAGVDIPGESLSAVIIDRIPFPTPDDPIVDAIAERDERGWFKNFAVPRAIIQFKQGVGRLLRTTTDAGVIVVLDRRLIDKAYGKLFIKSLPEMSVDSSLKRISSFLGAS